MTPRQRRRVRDVAVNGVDRIIEVSLSDNADFDAMVVGVDAVIAGSRHPRGRHGHPVLALLSSNLGLRPLGSDDFPLDAKPAAMQWLTAAQPNYTFQSPPGTR